MSEINAGNIAKHVQNLYHFAGTLAKNHNQIVDHLKNLHKNVQDLQKDVAEIKNSVKKQ